MLHQHIIKQGVILVSNKSISIVGAGNWLISYDRIGPKVLELVAGRYDSAVELCDIGSAGLALLDYLHGQELMLIVDACLQGKQPGEVCVIEPSLDSLNVNITSVHQIGPLETLLLAKRLFPEKMPQQIKLILVETNGIDDKKEAIACQEVLAILDREIEAWQQKTILNAFL